MDVLLDRFNAVGGILSTEPVATTIYTETNPGAAMDNAGNTIVAFQRDILGITDWDIIARKVFVTGELGPNYNLQLGVFQDTDPSVTVDYSDGDFVVAYKQNRGPDGIYDLVAKVESDSGPRRTPSSPPNAREHDAGQAAVAINGLDRYFVAFTLLENQGDESFGIFGRRGELL